MVKKSIHTLLAGLAAFSVVSLAANPETLTTSRNFFQPRAFSDNLAREMLMQGSMHRESTGWYGEFAATAAYQRQWNQSVDVDGEFTHEDGNALGIFPFWSGTSTMTYGTNLSDTNMDSYQFGLGGSSTAGSINLNPLVYQAGADFMFVVGSSAMEPCFYAKIKAPVGVYNINPNLTEVEGSVADYPAFALSSTIDTTLPDPAATMIQAFAGNLSGGQTAQGDFIRMQYGLIDGDQSTGAKFGDIEMTVGYRFISNEDNSFTVAVRAAAPTGGAAQGVYMLEPIFGRGGNWGLGGYVDGHARIWEGNNENSFVFKVMGYAQHLFNANTVRSFDLVANGGGSKYLLVADYSNDTYQGAIQNLINVDTLAATSSFAVEGDIVIDFAYVARGWTWDIGYEFWGRSAETLTITGDFANQAYAILGRQTVNPDDQFCQPSATISASEAAATVATETIVDATVAANRIALADLDIANAQQSTSLTSKVFTKVTYEWNDSAYRPHLGLMGEFEMSNSDNNALAQWSIALIGGVAF